MTAFRIGERVELISCPSFPGTVTGFARGKVQVRFDDFANEAPKALRPDSLQSAAVRSASVGVPETVAFGTGIEGQCVTANQSLGDRYAKSFLGQGRSYQNE